MARRANPKWPTGPCTVFFDDAAGSTTLSRAVKDSRIRRLAPKIYTADLSSDPAEIVLANPWKILAKLPTTGQIIGIGVEAPEDLQYR